MKPKMTITGIDLDSRYISYMPNFNLAHHSYFDRLLYIGWIHPHTVLELWGIRIKL